MILDALTDGIMVLDVHGRVLTVNAALCQMFDVDASRAVGRPPWLGIIGATDEDGRAIDPGDLMDVITRGSDEGTGIRLHIEVRDGRQLAFVVASRRLPSDVHRRGGEVPSMVLTATDITPQVTRERESRVENAQLRHRAHHDSLTGLANRTLFLEQMSQAGQTAMRRGTATGVIAIDLDGFKSVNDDLGHAVGDEVLVQVTIRLRSVIRDEDLAARLGGDEFVLLCEGLEPESPERALGDVVRRLDMTMREPYLTSAGPIDVGVSIGWAMAPPGAVLDLRTVSRADAVMLQTKRRRKGQAGTPDSVRPSRPDATARPGTTRFAEGHDAVAPPVTVFIVDDDPAMRLLARRVIETSGTSLSVVGEADGGANAIPGILEAQPDLVLCDVMMPRVSGPEVVAEVRRTRPSQPFVFWSATGETELRRYWSEIGVPFVTKDRIEQLPGLLLDLADATGDTLAQGSP